MIALVVTLWPQASLPEDSLRATSLVLVDKQGVECVRLAVAGDGTPKLRLSYGTSYVECGVQPSGEPFCNLGLGAPGVSIGIIGDGLTSYRSFLVVHDRRGEARGALQASGDPDGLSEIVLGDSAGRLRLVGSVSAQGEARLAILDPDEKVVWEAAR
ncbi:MAG: hypothetical protein ACT4PV_15615 [Planctomycetaceae bacterium]